jgi:hypothetical protein
VFSGLNLSSTSVRVLSFVHLYPRSMVSWRLFSCACGTAVVGRREVIFKSGSSLSCNYLYNCSVTTDTDHDYCCTRKLAAAAPLTAPAAAPPSWSPPVPPAPPDSSSRPAPALLPDRSIGTPDGKSEIRNRECGSGARLGSGLRALLHSVLRVESLWSF